MLKEHTSGSLDSSLDGDIRCHSVPVEVRREVLQEFWGPSCTHLGLTCDSYFRHLANQSSQALKDRGRHTSARTHRDIIEVAKFLKQPLTREEVVESLRGNAKCKTKPIDEKALQGTINLVARLLVMVEVGTVEFGFSGQTNISWASGTLQDCIAKHFDSPSVLNDHVKLEKIFNAQNLVQIGGLEIIWTDNLADHLRLFDDDKKIAIFHHASFLRYQETSLLPKTLTDETLRTLALLFPQTDATSRKWLRKICKLNQLDSGLLKVGSLKADDRQIERFHHWRDRLVVLKQVFDDAEPRGLSQWWYDRRRGVQWYTFWLAALILILTVVFGVIQSIEGALQVYKAFVPTKNHLSE